MPKSAEAFRTISEVAETLDTPAHVLRFWESRFPQVKPVKRAGGRRYYRPADVALLGGIKRLLHDQGLTIRGVQKILKEQGVRHVSEIANPARDLASESPQTAKTVWPKADSPDVTTSTEHFPPDPEDANPVADAPMLEDVEPEPLLREVVNLRGTAATEPFLFDLTDPAPAAAPATKPAPAPQTALPQTTLPQTAPRSATDAASAGDSASVTQRLRRADAARIDPAARDTLSILHERIAELRARRAAQHDARG